jgi:hypothetical protein
LWHNNKLAIDPEKILACWKWPKQILGYTERAQLPPFIRGNENGGTNIWGNMGLMND